MSTRGIVARVGDHEGTFRGVYNHSDSYPSWMGPHLWCLLRERYAGNVEKLVRELIEDHPGGWSCLGDTCYCHEWSRARRLK
jgi:hypothetical protein